MSNSVIFHSIILKDNKDIVLETVKYAGLAIKFASVRLKDYKEYIKFIITIIINPSPY